MAPFVAPPPPPLRHPHASRSSSRSHMPQLVMREPSRRMPASAPQDPILNEFRASPATGRELPELPRLDDEDGYMMAVPDEERRATSSAAPSSVPVPQEGTAAPSRAGITRERHRPADAPASSLTASSSYYSPSPGSGQQILTARQPSVHALPNFSTPSQVQEEHRSSGSSPGRGSPRESHISSSVTGQDRSSHRAVPGGFTTSTLCCCARLESYLPPAWGRTQPGHGGGDRPTGQEPQTGFMGWIMQMCQCCCCYCDDLDHGG